MIFIVFTTIFLLFIIATYLHGDYHSVKMEKENYCSVENLQV
jgi:hypothetical protein